jgi:hypothetical protein
MRMLKIAGAALAALLVLAAAAQAKDKPSTWRFGGGNAHNTRSADAETKIGAANVGTLTLLWSVTLKGAVTAATPVSDGKSLFLPTSLGHVVRIERATGKVEWDVAVDELTGIAGAASKASVALTAAGVVLWLQKTPLVVALA